MHRLGRNPYSGYAPGHSDPGASDPEQTIYDYGDSIIEWPSGYWRSKVEYGPPVQPEYVPEWPFEDWGALGQEREEGDLC